MLSLWRRNAETEKRMTGISAERDAATGAQATALHLLSEIAVQNHSTIVFPAPLDLSAADPPYATSGELLNGFSTHEPSLTC
jgi:hypothetical protein